LLLNSQTQLFQVGSFNFKLNHIVIIGVLVLAFSISFLIRSQPADYGNELMEFDPLLLFVNHSLSVTVTSNVNDDPSPEFGSVVVNDTEEELPLSK